MAKKRKKKTEVPTIEIPEDLLPSVPNYAWVDAQSKEPPKGVVLLLECEYGYILGAWDGVYYFDSGDTKIETQYGKVMFWSILFTRTHEVVFVPKEEDA